MIGIVLAAHGPLPEALLESARMIAGEFEQVSIISLMPGDSLEGLVERIRAAVDEVNSGDGVLILIDLFGGTPSNAATLITQQVAHTYAASGVNVPMMLETLLTRPHASDARSLAETAVASGSKGIVNIVDAFQAYREGKSSAESD